MYYVRGFAPWLCYAVLSAFDWRLGLSAAALASLILLVTQLRGGAGLDTLGTATTVFFVVMAVIAIADPASVLHNWTTALSNGVLAAVALTSLIVRRPFTLSISRAQVPEKFWHAPRFIHVNMVITGIWAAAFTASAISSALIVGFAHAATIPLVAVQILAFVIPLVAGTRYANHAKAAAERVTA
ncbi:MAG TPA: hypothetical protein VGN81_24345 [Pseudonocardiaceae bacterium]